MDFFQPLTVSPYAFDRLWCARCRRAAAGPGRWEKRKGGWRKRKREREREREREGEGQERKKMGTRRPRRPRPSTPPPAAAAAIPLRPAWWRGIEGEAAAAAAGLPGFHSTTEKCRACLSVRGKRRNGEGRKKEGRKEEQDEGKREHETATTYVIWRR